MTFILGDITKGGTKKFMESYNDLKLLSLRELATRNIVDTLM